MELRRQRGGGGGFRKDFARCGLIKSADCANFATRLRAVAGYVATLTSPA